MFQTMAFSFAPPCCRNLEKAGSSWQGIGMDQKDRIVAALSPQDDRKARLAAELRENLKRRKEQKRVRARLTQAESIPPASETKGEG